MILWVDFLQSLQLLLVSLTSTKIILAINQAAEPALFIDGCKLFTDN